MDQLVFTKEHIKRFVESRTRAIEESSTMGKESGRKWALEDADYDMLFRLATWREVHEVGFQHGDDCASQLMEVFFGPDWVSNGFSEEEVFGEDVDGLRRNCAYFDGFVEGAVEVYRGFPSDLRGI